MKVRFNTAEVLLLLLISIFLISSSSSGIVEAQEFPSNYVWEIAWSYDSTYIAAGLENGSIQIFDAANGDLLHSIIAGAGGVLTLDWHPSSYQLVSGNRDGAIQIWDISATPITNNLLGFHADISTVAWHPNGSQLWSTTITGNSNPKIWSTTGILDDSFNSLGTTHEIDWNGDATVAALGVFVGGVSLVDTQDPNNFSYVGEYVAGGPIAFSDAVEVVDWSPTQDIIATGTTGGKVIVWDVTSNSRIYTLDGNQTVWTFEEWFLASIKDVRFSDDGQLLYSVSGDGVVRTWDVADGSLVDESLLPSPTYAAAFSPDGTQIAYAGTNNTVQVVPAPIICDLAFTIANGDTAALISAIESANGTPEPDTICLADNGIYTLSAAHSRLNGLPLITSEVTLIGNGATVTRDTGAGEFRLLEIASTGSLTLRDLTLGGWISQQ